MTNLNQYDFVIYGATGFTGKLVGIKNRHSDQIPFLIVLHQLV